jgi:hypothetical protein
MIHKLKLDAPDTSWWDRSPQKISTPLYLSACCHSLKQRRRARFGLRHRTYPQPSRYEITPSPCHSTGRIRLLFPAPFLAMGLGCPNFCDTFRIAACPTAVKHDPLPCVQPSPKQEKLGGELRKAAGQCREKGGGDAWRPRWSGCAGKRRKRAPPPLGGRHLAGGIGRRYSSWSWKGWLRRARTRAGSSQGAAQD